jgi:hypothetical protein
MGEKEPSGHKRSTEHRKSKADIGIPALTTDFAVIGEIPPPHASDAVFEAIGRIFAESAGLPEQAGAITKAKLYRDLLGVEARIGQTIVVDGKEKHIKGQYEKHSDLSKREVDDVLNATIVDLADAKVSSFIGIFLDRKLKTACGEKRNKHGKSK